jgi:L-fuconolactonase
MNSPAAIVDAHVHFWNPALRRYDWLDGLPVLNRAFLPEDFAVASAGAHVAKMIFVECGCKTSQSLAEVDWVSHLAKTDTRVRGIVANARLEKGLGVRDEIAALAARPLVKGVRRLLEGERDAGFCLRPEFISGVKLLAEFGFTFDLCVRHEQLRAVTELVRRVPEVQFILDHLGKPPVREGKIRPWAGELKALGTLPNISCKLSGLTTEADWQGWQPAQLQPHFEVAREAFGFDRLLFGGDWPVCTLATEYPRWVDTVAAATADANEADRKKLFQSNAERIYRI